MCLANHLIRNATNKKEHVKDPRQDTTCNIPKFVKNALVDIIHTPGNHY